MTTFGRSQRWPCSSIMSSLYPVLSRIINVFMTCCSDVLSFYKEERVGETTNQISILAARTKKSKGEVLGELTETTIGIHKRIVKILERSPEASAIYKRFTAGYIHFHTSTARYRLKDLDL